VLCLVAWPCRARPGGPGVPGHVAVAFPVRGRRVLGLVAWRSWPGGPDIPGRVALTCPRPAGDDSSASWCPCGGSAGSAEELPWLRCGENALWSDAAAI